MKLLVDNCLSYRIAHALASLFTPDHEIVALRDKFPADTADIDWITSLHREGSWAVLTRDLRIRTRPHERLAMDASEIVYFFLASGWKKRDVAETAAGLILAGSKLRPYRD